MESLGTSAAWQTPAVSTNPYAAPSYAPLPAYGSQRTNGSGTRIATIVCGILTAIYGGFYTLASLIAAVGLMFAGTAAFSFASQNSNLTSNDEARMVGMAAGAVAAVVLFLAMFVIVLIGGIQMARFRKWGLSLAASILCVVPALLACFSFNPCTILFNVPGAALGFWGILMLCNASVKQQFR